MCPHCTPLIDDRTLRSTFTRRDLFGGGQNRLRAQTARQTGLFDRQLAVSYPRRESLSSPAPSTGGFHGNNRD